MPVETARQVALSTRVEPSRYLNQMREATLDETRARLLELAIELRTMREDPLHRRPRPIG